MILHKAKEGIPMSQSDSPDHKNSLKWQKIAQNHPQDVMFRSVRGPDRCCIGNQPLYF